MERPDAETESEEPQEWTLDTLPTEILLYITTFIPAPDLVHSLALVSKHFYNILNNEKTWEIRANKKWRAKFPPVEFDVTKGNFQFLHRMATLKREETADLWSKENKTLTLTPHIAVVDAVYLYKGNSMLVSGSRDRSIAVVDLDNSIESGEVKSELKANAHAGWVWDFCTVQNGEVLVSGGWDGFVKLWDMQQGTMKEICQYKTASPALSLSSESNLVSIGTFDSKIHLYDVRTQEKVKVYKAHRRSVLAIGLENGKIVSAGEDNRVVLHDLRMDKLSSGVIQLPQSNNQTKTYPKSISYAKTNASNQLPYFYIGDIRGNLYLVDLNSFKIKRTYAGIHSKAVQGVFHTLGSVYTCSSDGMLIVHDPSAELGIVKKIALEKVELPKVHCLNSRVALATTNGIVVYYK